MERSRPVTQLLTQSLSGIHARAGVNNMADLATKTANVPPTFFHNLLTFFNGWEGESLFFSIIHVFFSAQMGKNIGLGTIS